VINLGVNSGKTLSVLTIHSATAGTLQLKDKVVMIRNGYVKQVFKRDFFVRNQLS